MDFGGGGMMGWLPQALKDTREDLWNERAYYQAGVNRQNQVEDAQRAMTFEKDMYSNRYTLQVQDLIRAGLNPMLAVGQSPGGAPSGVMPGQPQLAGAARTNPGMEAASAVASMSLVNAQREKLEAEAGEIRARTPTYDTQIDSMKQQIEESRTRILDLIASVGQRGSSARHYEQSIVNMQAELPRIRSTVELLKAQTVESLTRAGLDAARAREVQQAIDQNLPELEKAYKEMELRMLKYQEPGAAQQAMVDDSFFSGTMARVAKALNPFGGVFGAIPLGRSAPAAGAARSSAPRSIWQR